MIKQGAVRIDGESASRIEGIAIPVGSTHVYQVGQAQICQGGAIQRLGPAAGHFHWPSRAQGRVNGPGFAPKSEANSPGKKAHSCRRKSRSEHAGSNPAAGQGLQKTRHFWLTDGKVTAIMRGSLGGRCLQARLQRYMTGLLRTGQWRPPACIIVGLPGCGTLQNEATDLISAGVVDH